MDLMTHPNHTTRWTHIGLALLTLPLLIVAPLLSGTVLIHRHGSEFHLHRAHARVAAEALVRHAAGHHHEHPHVDDCAHGAPLPCEPAHPHDGDDPCDGIVIVVPETTIAPAPTPASTPHPHTASTAEFVMVPRASCSSRLLVTRGEAHGPPARAGAEAVLLANHALLL